MFGWPDKKDAAPDAGGAGEMGTSADASATHSGSVADAANAAAVEAARSAANASPRAKRGRPPGSGTSGERNQRNLQAQIDAAIAAQLDALHDPEAWGALCALPGDAIVSITGRARWEISKDERKTLGVTGAAFARTLMITNPRGLAALMFASAIFGVYGTRALAELREYNDKKKAESAGKPDAAK